MCMWVYAMGRAVISLDGPKEGVLKCIATGSSVANTCHQGILYIRAPWGVLTTGKPEWPMNPAMGVI
jgi:hypothetical protein